VTLPPDHPSFTGEPPVNLGHDVTLVVLRAIEAGWNVALQYSDVNANAQELTLNERLRDGMRSSLASGNFLEKIVVLPGTESRSRPDVVAPDGRTDIPIFVIKIFSEYGLHDPHAIIECKRVAGNKAALCRKYVVEGIDRFRDGKYGGSHRIGFMIGYLIASDVIAAVQGINHYLQNKSRETERLAPSDLINTYWAWHSTHPLAATSPMKLHHAFLSFPEP